MGSLGHRSNVGLESKIPDRNFWEYLDRPYRQGLVSSVPNLSILYYNASSGKCQGEAVYKYSRGNLPGKIIFEGIQGIL